MRYEPVEIVRQYINSAFSSARAETLVAPDAVFVDLSPVGGALRLEEKTNVFVGRAEFLAATREIMEKTSSGELVVTSLFGSGGNVAGFGTMIRVEGPDLTEMSAPVAIWAKVAHGRLRFLQYLEFAAPRAGELPHLRGAATALMAVEARAQMRLASA